MQYPIGQVSAYINRQLSHAELTCKILQNLGWEARTYKILQNVTFLQMSLARNYCNLQVFLQEPSTVIDLARD